MSEENKSELTAFAFEEIEPRTELSTCFTLELCSSPIPPRFCIGVKVCLP